MSKYSDSIKKTADFFKNDLSVFAFSFIGTSVYITLSKENSSFDNSLLKNMKNVYISSYIDKQYIQYDTYESAIEDLNEGKAEFIIISGEAKLPLFNVINSKFVEIYNDV